MGLTGNQMTQTVPAVRVQILDRSRDYGSVIPPLEGRAHYEQDGLWFDQDFRRVRLKDEPPDEDKPVKPSGKGKAKKTVDPAADSTAAIYDKPPWRRHTQKAQFTPKDGTGRKRKYPRAEKTIGAPAPQALPKAAAEVKAAQVNLTAWALGEEKLLFGTVKSEIRTRFNVVVSKEADALAVLVREKVVKAEDIPGYGEGQG